MKPTWKERCEAILEQRWHRLRESFPDKTPLEVWDMVDQRFPFTETTNAVAMHAWAEAVGDCRIRHTRPDLLEQFGVKPVTPLFSQPELKSEPEQDLGF